jgi:hypothetical protein
VQADPRPLVLAGPAAWPERGFRSGAGKIAFMGGSLSCSRHLPEVMLDIVRVLRAGKITRPLARGERPVEPLVISAVEHADADFRTDRGRQRLPAYRLMGPDIIGAIWVLDPAVTTRTWAPPASDEPPPNSPHRLPSVEILDAAGQHLRVSFTGGPQEWIHYDAEVIASDQALVVLPIATDHGPPGPRTAVGYRRSVDVHLDEPLGNRVVLDLDATPIAVTLAGATSSAGSQPDPAPVLDIEVEPPTRGPVSAEDLHRGVHAVILAEIARYEPGIATVEVQRIGSQVAKIGDRVTTTVQWAGGVRDVRHPSFSVSVFDATPWLGLDIPQPPGPLILSGHFGNVWVEFGDVEESLPLMRLFVAAVLSGNYEEAGGTVSPLGRFYSPAGVFVAGALSRAANNPAWWRFWPYGNLRP